MVDYKMSASQMASELGSDLEKGLTIEKAHERIHSRGRNRIHIPKTSRKVGQIFKQTLSLMNILLILMAVIHLIYDSTNGVFLSVCLLACAAVNSIVGYINFSKSSELSDLAEIEKQSVRVIRNGIENKINTQLLAQGDVFLLEKDDIVPADAKIISCENLIVDESVVNGGAASAIKSAEGTYGDEELSCLYMGSKILTGSAKAIVITVGENTLLGSAIGSLKGETKEKSVFAKRIEVLGNICTIAAALMWTIALFLRLSQGYGIISAIDNSIAAAITAVPISLSVVLLAAMTLDAGKMRKNGIDIASISTLEAMGGATVLCVGKRGIVTEPGFKVGEVVPNAGFNENQLRLLGAMCTTIDLSKDVLSGDAIQLALVKDAMENGITAEEIRTKAPIVKVADNRSSKGLMATMHKREGGYTIVVKGSPETVLSCCSYIYDNAIRPIDPKADIPKNVNTATQIAQKGMTVIAIAFKDTDTADGDLLSEMTFAGMIGLCNPIRKDTADSIKKLNAMGVKTCIITDEKMPSAEVLAKECGIDAVSGIEALQYPPTKIKRSVIFAETPVASKMNLVEKINSRQENAAVVGRSSKDIAAMGMGEASVATSDSAGVCISGAGVRIKGSGLSVVYDAIKECRRSFINSHNLIGFLLSCNIAQMVCALISLIIGYSIPFSPMGIIWLNALMGAVGAAAIWSEPYHKTGTKRNELMRMKNGSLSKSSLSGAVGKGLITGLAVMAMYASMLEKSIMAQDRRFAVFMSLCVSFIFMAQSCRSSEPIYKRMGKNKTALICMAIQALLAAMVLLWEELRIELGLSQNMNKSAIIEGMAVGLIPFVLAELYKILFKRKGRKK